MLLRRCHALQSIDGALHNRQQAIQPQGQQRGQFAKANDGHTERQYRHRRESLAHGQHAFNQRLEVLSRRARDPDADGTAHHNRKQAGRTHQNNMLPEQPGKGFLRVHRAFKLGKQISEQWC